jgi:purine nucleosidase
MTIWDLRYEAPVRVLIDTDVKNEADDQFAIVHALLSPSLEVRGVIPAHFGQRRSRNSMQESRAEVDLILGLLNLTGKVRVEDGAPGALVDPNTPIESAGAQLIIEEALKAEEAPLFVSFLGPLTDMASALLLEPRIARRDLKVIWIGGPPYVGGAAYSPEFNLSNDVIAAEVVFSSSLELWQVPMSTYVMMGVSHAELYEKVRPCGEIGNYLVTQLIEFNEMHAHRSRSLEFRSLGDSPAVGLMLNPAAGTWEERPAPGFNLDGSYDHSRSSRLIRVYNSIDSRFILSDMFAKLRAFAALS